jgi:uncharacterized protein YkwD
MIRLNVALLVFGLVLLVAMMVTKAEGAGTCAVSDVTMDAQETLFVSLLNQYRATRALPVLSVAPALNQSASWMVVDETVHGYFSHTDSLGRDPFTRMHDCGYPQAGGENLAQGNLPGAQAVLSAWQSSPGHNAALLQPGFTQLGIAHYGSQWALDFGFGASPWPTVVPTPTPFVVRPHIFIPAIGRDGP